MLAWCQFVTDDAKGYVLFSDAVAYSLGAYEIVRASLSRIKRERKPAQRELYGAEHGWRDHAVVPDARNDERCADLVERRRGLDDNIRGERDGSACGYAERNE